MKKLFYLFIISSLIISCKKNDSIATVDSTYNYFPVDIGRTWIYDVDSLAYDNNSGVTTIDSSYYQYKEIITENFIDDEGKPAQKLARYYRKNDADSWVSANIWVISRDNLRAQKIEENIRFVKLVFPLSAGSSWDGNMFNNKGMEMYSLDYFDQPATINGISYAKTLQVLQVLDTNAIDEIRRYEIYARNIGMIYFQSDSINTQPVDTLGHTESRGLRYRLRLKSFQ